MLTNVINQSSINNVFLSVASTLYAIGVTHIDYFPLDVEGPELEILETIPFDKITDTSST